MGFERISSAVGKQPPPTLPPPVKATVSATTSSNGENKLTTTASQQLSAGRKLEFTSELSNQARPNNRVDFVSEGRGPWGSKSELRVGIDNRGVVAKVKASKEFGRASASAEAEGRPDGLSGKVGVDYTQPLGNSVRASVGASVVMPERAATYLNLPASLTLDLGSNVSVKAQTSLNGRLEEPSTIGLYWGS